MKLLREAAARLAPVREAHVAVNSLKSVQSQLTGKRGAKAFSHTARGLRLRLRNAMQDFAEKRGARKTRKLLRRFLRTLDDCRVRKKGWDAIGPGVKTRYEKARACRQQARANPLPAHLHEWRKRTKDIWYCLHLLRESNPGQIAPLADAFGRLGDALGDDHDLWMLRRAARRVAGDDRSELARLADLIARRRRESQTTVFELGTRLFAETPANFHKKLARYWKAWRSGTIVRANSRR
jgi:CHAD domain-containing protein